MEEKRIFKIDSNERGIEIFFGFSPREFSKVLSIVFETKPQIRDLFFSALQVENPLPISEIKRERFFIKIEIIKEYISLEIKGNKETGKDLITATLKEDNELLEAVVIAKKLYDLKNNYLDRNQIIEKSIKCLIESNSPEDFIKRMDQMKVDLLKDINLEEQKNEIENVIKDFKKGI